MFGAYKILPRCVRHAGATLLLTLASTLSLVQARADALDDGRAAWRRGDYDVALDLLEPLAEAGDAHAQATLALMYEFGTGVPRAPQRAAQYYEAAAPSLDAEFRHSLAMKYYSGEGLHQDYARAAHWWASAARDGLPQSQYDLGLLYYAGAGVDVDYEKTAYWYRRAAEQDFARAQHGLGILHATGRGVGGADYAEAAEWFERAADQGFPKAQYNLALLLLSGRGVDADAARASALLTRAAEAGERDARRLLATLESEGGIEQLLAARDGRTSQASAPVKAAPAVPAGTVSSPARRAMAGDGPMPSSSFAAAEASAWTVQLASLSNALGARRFAERVRRATDETVFEVAYATPTGMRHAVIVGIYKAREQARGIVPALQPLLDGAEPWIRRVGDVQALLPPSSSAPR